MQKTLSQGMTAMHLMHSLDVNPLLGRHKLRRRALKVSRVLIALFASSGQYLSFDKIAKCRDAF